MRTAERNSSIIFVHRRSSGGRTTGARPPTGIKRANFGKARTMRISVVIRRRPRGRSVVARRRPRRLVVRTMRMSVVARRRSRRLALRIYSIATGAVPLQHCALIKAVKFAAIRIASLASSVPPAPVYRTDEHPVCESSTVIMPFSTGGSPTPPCRRRAAAPRRAFRPSLRRGLRLPRPGA